MSLTIDLSHQSRLHTIAPASDLQPVLAVPALVAALFFSLAPVTDTHPLAAPGQRCQERLAAADAALDAHDHGGELVLIVP